MPVELQSIAVIPEKPAVLMTPLVRHLSDLAEFAYRKRQIVAYSGRTGIGKTVAVSWLAYHLAMPKVVLRCRAITVKSQIVSALALGPEAARRLVRRHTSAEMFDMAVDRYRDQPPLLIFDEADRLKEACFELLRDFWDEIRLPMLLVGNEGLEPKIDRQLERLARRIRRYRERDLRQPELRQVLEYMGYEMSDQEFQLIWKHCGGSPGWAEAVLGLADYIAERHSTKRGVEDVAGALELVPARPGK